MSSVSQILQALAENAGNAQLRRGAIYGGLAAGVGQLPEQIAQDRERDTALRLHQAQVQQQMDLERARAALELEAGAALGYEVQRQRRERLAAARQRRGGEALEGEARAGERCVRQRKGEQC